MTQWRTVLGQYMPGGTTGSPYAEGGALYALGLIHANHGSSVVGELTGTLTAVGRQTDEIVQHGACLGLGLAAMGSSSSSVFDVLQGVLNTDSAVVGESVGIAMGLVHMGSGDGNVVQSMLAYAKETQHDKIIRGLALGIALAMYNMEQNADVVIDQLCLEKVPTAAF